MRTAVRIGAGLAREVMLVPATVSSAWQAQIVATDADNDPIDFYLSGAPAGMAVDVTVHRRQGAGGGRG